MTNAEIIEAVRRAKHFVVSKEHEEAMDAVIAALEKQSIPAADVVEVRRGEWEVVHGVFTPGGDPWVRCPFCRGKNTEHLEGIEMPKRWNYCPNCGAEMDGGVNDA